MVVSENALGQKRYHSNAYEFIYEALRYTQEMLNRSAVIEGMNEDEAHISGGELLQGVRLLAQEKYGLLTITVFKHWGVTCTEDFGRIVFDLIERGEMRKTERDRLSDFVDVFDFQQAFRDGYHIDVHHAFQ